MLTTYKRIRREKVDVGTSVLTVFGASSWATGITANSQQSVVHLTSISANTVYVRVVDVTAGGDPSSTDYDYVLDSTHRTADILVPPNCKILIVASASGSTVAALEIAEIA